MTNHEKSAFYLFSNILAKDKQQKASLGARHVGVTTVCAGGGAGGADKGAPLLLVLGSAL